MKIKMKLRNKLIKESQKGFRGFPVGTVAYYGPDDQRASKVAVGIINFEGAKPIMRKFFTETTDARFDERLTDEIMKYLKDNNIVSVAAIGKIIGCPHEEVIDYPEGETCPQCPYWADKDRFAGIEEEL
jgi:hypothetical protein